MSAISASLAPASPVPSTNKAVSAHVAVIPAIGTAATITPADAHNSVVFMNVAGTVYVRARINFAAGITGNATAAQQVVLIPPSSSVALDFGGDDHATPGELRAILSVVFDSVALPAASAEVSTLTALTALASATVIASFAHAG